MSFDFIAFTTESNLDSKTDKQAHFPFEHYTLVRGKMKELLQNPIAPYSKNKGEGKEINFLEKIKNMGKSKKKTGKKNIDYIVKVDKKQYYKVHMINTESQHNEDERFMNLIGAQGSNDECPRPLYPYEEQFEITLNGSVNNDIFKPQTFVDEEKEDEKEKEIEEEGKHIPKPENKKLSLNPEALRAEWLKKVYLNRKVKNIKKQKLLMRNKMADESQIFKTGSYFKIKYLPQEETESTEPIVIN